MDSSRLFQLSVEITVVWPMLSLHHLFIAHGCLMITVKLSQWLSYAVSRITSIHVFTADDHLRAGRKPGRYSVRKPRRIRRCIFPVLRATTQTQPPTVKDNNGSYLLRGMKAKRLIEQSYFARHLKTDPYTAIRCWALIYPESLLSSWTIHPPFPSTGFLQLWVKISLGVE